MKSLDPSPVIFRTMMTRPPSDNSKLLHSNFGISRHCRQIDTPCVVVKVSSTREASEWSPCAEPRHNTPDSCTILGRTSKYGQEPTLEEDEMGCASIGQVSWRLPTAWFISCCAKTSASKSEIAMSLTCHSGVRATTASCRSEMRLCR